MRDLLSTSGATNACRQCVRCEQLSEVQTGYSVGAVVLTISCLMVLRVMVFLCFVRPGYKCVGLAGANENAKVKPASLYIGTIILLVSGYAQSG